MNSDLKIASLELTRPDHLIVEDLVKWENMQKARDVVVSQSSPC
jgi:hypothetical protein